MSEKKIVYFTAAIRWDVALMSSEINTKIKNILVFN